jgi:N-acetylornithine carbamoyltransferase
MNFYHLGELSAASLDGLIQRSADLAQGATPASLRGLSLGLLFLAPSLRTSASFQRAASLLDLDLVQLGAGTTWALETDESVVMDAAAAEHVREAASVLGSYVDALGVRAFPRRRSLADDRMDPVLQAFMQHCAKPIINMESTRWHPCQALADRLTLEQLKLPRRARLVLTWAWHPKPLPHAVPNSTLCMAAQRGMDVVLLHPPGFELHPEVIAEAQALAHDHAGELSISHDRKAALEGADVVYAKSWGSLSHWCDPKQEARLRASLRDWCVTPDWLGKQAHFMHCLPIRRNVVASDAVLDGPHSRVLRQSENRLYAQMAILENLLESHI